MQFFKNILPLLFFFCIHSVYGNPQWEIDEHHILEQAAQENLPVVAVFMSVEGCPWSHKFVEEILQSPHFVHRIGVDAILWEILLGSSAPDAAMREKYGVQQSPQIVLLDPQGREFARVGYLPLDTSSYAEKIMGLIDGFQEVCEALDHPKAPFDEELWQQLYLKACQFSVPCFKQVILEKGVKKEKGTFFHVEKYALLLEKYKLKNPDMLRMKHEILKRDPSDKLDTHFKIALLDFQKRAAMLKAKDRCEKALVPLFRYVQQFKDQQGAHLWEVELMIAEYLYSKHALSPALEHAHASLKSAPESARSQVLQAISYMQRQ